VDFVAQAIPPEAARHHLDTMIDDMLSAINPAAVPPDAVGDELSEKVLRVCAAALGMSRVAPTDNFFQLGGDSVSATRVVEQLSRELSTAATLRLLFEHPVIGDFAAQLRTVVGGAESEFEEGVL
jgi:yersiniabactin nonribosomal peptide synthetase